MMDMLSEDVKSLKHMWLAQLLQTQLVRPGIFNKELEIATFEMDCSQKHVLCYTTPRLSIRELHLVMKTSVPTKQARSVCPKLCIALVAWDIP